jgi:hypothetical protein
MSRSIPQTSVVAAFALLLTAAACQSRTAPSIAPEKHLAQLTRQGASLYVDRVDNRVVLQPGKTAQNKFCSFRIGWTDSLAVTGKSASPEKERYFQYTVQHDWKALAGGDTLIPVFFQEKPGLNQQLKEGVMVFETPTGRQPDTLVYRDSFGAWGTQILILNRK